MELHLLSYKTAALILRLEFLTNFYADSHTGAIESSGNKKKNDKILLFNKSLWKMTRKNDLPVSINEILLNAVFGIQVLR